MDFLVEKIASVKDGCLDTLLTVSSDWMTTDDTGSIKRIAFNQKKKKNNINQL